jgi:hypothetical protein
MTQDDIIVLWKDANGWDVRGYKNTLEDLERFAKLVAKHTLMNIDPSKFISCQEVMEAARLAEREACAKVCDGLADMHEKMNQWGSHKTADTLAQAIRARGEQA